MIYLTGDIHGETKRFSKKNFPEQENMTRDDYVISKDAQAYIKNESVKYFL